MTPKANSKSDESLPIRFVEKFQGHCGALVEHHQTRIESYSSTVRHLGANVRLALRKKKLSLADQKTLREYASYGLERDESERWLEANEEKYISICEATPSEIDLHDPEIAPLWQDFAEQLRSTLLKEVELLDRFGRLDDT